MPVISESVFSHAHDETLTATAHVVPPPATVVDLAERREAAAAELRLAFCEQLKACRERRGISLHAIAEATKVAEGLFADLERCDVSRWPTGIYRRSFFREYVAFLGLPVDTTVAEFVRLFPEEVERSASGAEIVPGPLRLTIDGPFWRQLSPLQVQAASLDLGVIAAAGAALSWAAGVGLSAALGLTAVLYFTAGTLVLSCSPATWFLRSRAHRRRSRATLPLAILLALACTAAPASAQQTSTFTPEVGQAGKDVVWVPTPEAMVQRMMELAEVTPSDFVMDLGSGDGRNVIAAARRGASALGVEYNPDMVALSKRLADEAGVGDKAQFVQGDMFTADISKADVLALFLLPSNLLRLRDKFLDLRPGSRLVLNTFSIQDWEADETVVLDNCDQWCTAMLYIVPAKAGGTWRAGNDVLELKQEFQMLSGTLTTGGETLPVTGQMRGNDVSLKAGSRTVTGRLQGTQIVGTIDADGKTSEWRATRQE